MSDLPPLIEQFNARRVDLRQHPADAALFSECVFGVGLLLGGDWPGAAAALAILMEHRFPPDTVFPWGPT